jgi:N-acetylated-alpha-linked acidic dipeptidase
MHRYAYTALVFTALVYSLLGQSQSSAQAVKPSDSILGFPPKAVAPQQALEANARSRTSSENIGGYMRVMAAEPHHAGTENSKKVAEYILQTLRKSGLQAEFSIFEVMLPYPKDRLLELQAPRKYRAVLEEPEIDQDPDSKDKNQLPTFNAYAGNGDVTAPLVYVNYGIPEDYDALEKLGISVKGKIVIARYGQSWRGIKPRLAQERGAVGCIIYSDPLEDGFKRGAVYPEGPHRPPQGVQRGSVMDMPIYPGDPTTPFTPSVPGAERVPVSEAATILKIPVLPISYSDAQPLLESLGGEEVPESWRGGLPITYRYGDGGAIARLKIENSFELRKIYNVIATIPGKDFPDEWVIYGNHHDAWVNGANDPVSGAAVVLETGRVLGSLYREGWRPSRTIKLAFWDAEEYGLIGSTEWVEQYAAELQKKLVAYFNSDSNGRGQLRAAGSHHLAPFLRELIAEVEDPASKQSVLEARMRIARGMDGEDKPFPVEAAGSGSDYTAFLHHITMPSLNMGFGGGCPSRGVYHSIYDSITWYEKHCDPGHTYGKALSDVMLTVLLRLSNAPLLPYDFVELSKTIDIYRDEVEKLAAEKGYHLETKPMVEALAKLESEAEQWNNWVAANKDAVSANASALRTINTKLISAERQLATQQGLPSRPWYRHQIYAPGLFTGYGVKTLPGIRESLEQGQPALANENVQNVSAAILGLADYLRELRSEAESTAALSSGN